MKKAVAPIAIILVASCLTAVMIWQKRAPAKVELPEHAILVETIALESRDVQFKIATQGSVTPRTETTLISEISGTVMEVSPTFIAGGFFNKDDILISIDPSDYEVAVEQARASLAGMNARLALEIAQAEQAEKEWDMSGLSRERAPLLALRTPYLDEAKANVLNAEAQLKKARRKLYQTKIRAPYEGMVKTKHVDIGQYVSTGTPLGDTFAIDFAEVRLPLTDQDIAYIELPTLQRKDNSATYPNPRVELKSTIGGQTYNWNAEIVRTEGVIDARSRVRYAVARITDPYAMMDYNGNPPLSVGSYVTANIQGIRVKDIISIPPNAVRESNRIYVMDATMQLRIREIQVVRSDTDFVYAINVLKENERLITSAVEVAVEGMLLRSTTAF